MKRLLAVLIGMVLTGSAIADERPLSVLFIAGQDTHGWGAHDHNPSSAVLSEALKDAMGDAVQIKVVWSKWPTKDDFSKADVCVVYSDGWNRSVVKGKERLEQIEGFMAAGKGVLRIHWATGSDPSENAQHRALFGGNMESDYSVHSTIWNQKFSLAEHPITNGMKPFELFDECYFYLHWVDEARTGVTDILTAKPGPGFKAGSITPASRKSLQRNEPQAVAWAYERPQGGKAFSFTGGHFHWDWANDNSRKMILNAIVWAGGREVPKAGLNSNRPTAQRLLNLMEERGHKKNPNWTAEALQPLLEKMNQPGGKIDWRRPPLEK